jgi:hypothetical protein
MSVSAISFAKPARTVRKNGPLLDLDPQVWGQAVGRSELGISHALAGHASFTLEALAELADRLPAAAIESHEGRQPLLVPGGAPDLAGRPSETVRTIDTNGRWMVLWNIEQVPHYRKLLDEILDPVAPFVPAREGAMGRREAFLFLSAPGSVTPVHFDPEHNFLLQIRGIKHFHVGRFPDRAAELAELDRYHDGGHRNLERIPPLSTSFTMHPGEGVYVYPWAPHWVENGPAASISLSITFRTRLSERHERVHRFNRRARRLGRSPRPPGESPSADRAKSAVVEFVGWLRRGGRRQRGARDVS